MVPYLSRIEGPPPKKKLAYHLFDKSKARTPIGNIPPLSFAKLLTLGGADTNPRCQREPFPLTRQIENRLMCSSKCS